MRKGEANSFEKIGAHVNSVKSEKIITRGDETLTRQFTEALPAYFCFFLNT